MCAGAATLEQHGFPLSGTPSLFLNGYKIQDCLGLQAWPELMVVVDAFADA